MSSANRFIVDLDGIDAAVFSGDILENDEARKELKEHAERWLRAVEEHEENENGE